MEKSSPSLEPNRRKPTPEFTWEDLATASLPVLACFIGGATEKWAEGIIVALLGLLLLLNPPRFSHGPVFHGILLALVACAALAFCPSAWFFEPAWRQALVHDFGIGLPATASPQPWITSGCLLSFLAGLCWLYYVAGGDVEIRAARRQLRIFAIGVIVLAAFSILLYRAHTALPFWHNQRGFGPFPNRNQTATLFGITSVLIVACAHDEIRHRKKRWIFWLAGLAVIVAALVLNFSRAGLGLLVIGGVAWLLVLILRSGSMAKIAIGLSTLLLVVAALLVFGGETFERFHLRGAAGETLARDFRWLVFHHTWELIRASPWCGIGLGNFQSVFAIFRDASLGQGRALHPESDWLWLCAELGWPGVILVLAGGAILVRRAFPFVEGTNQWFRLATLISTLLFALHGLVDVSGHRVGTAFAGIFLLGMTLRRPLRTRASVALTKSFRVVGMILIVVGLTWVVTVYREIPLAGSVGVDVEKHLASTASVGRSFNETIERSTQALVWAPLDWQLYFQRALGKVGAKRPPADALDDFRRARFLEPGSFEVPYQEGVAWLMRDRLLTLTAWREALRRAGPERQELYARMLSTAATLNPGFSRTLEDFGDTQSDLALIYLARVSGENFRAALNRWLQRDPALQTLTPEQRRQLFDLWMKQGDLAPLANYVEAHPESLSLAWRGVATQRASAKDFRGAFELTKQFGEKPKLPEVSSGASIEELQKRALGNPNDYEAGLALCQKQMQENKIDDALVTVRRFTTQPNAPAYFHFLEAASWAEKGNWQRAWNAWQAFDGAKRK